MNIHILKSIRPIGVFLALMFIIPVGANEKRINDNVIQTPMNRSGVGHVEHQETESLQTIADRWNLSVEEIKRYQELMKGPLGYWNTSIDPLLALGMFAETPQQERRYAELYAQQEFELTQRALRFQRTYRSAFNRLYPNTNILNSRLLQPYYENRELKQSSSKKFDLARRQFMSGDQILYFVSPSCSSCVQIANRLLSQISSIDNTVVNVYLLDVETDQNVQEWALKNRIDPGLVKNGKLTLNRDQGLYNTLREHSVSTASSSTVYLHRNNRYFQLNTGDLGL